MLQPALLHDFDNFWQQFLGRDERADLGLRDTVFDAVVAQVGIYGGEGDGVLEAADGGHQPLGARVGENADFFPWLDAQLADAPAKVVGVAGQVRVLEPGVVAEDQLVEQLAVARPLLLLLLDDGARA